MFCKNQQILYKDVKNKIHIEPLDNQLTYFSNKKIFLPHILNKKFTLIGCGKCETCLEAKKRIYSKRINHEFKHTNYAYLLTLTFDDGNIITIKTKQEQEQLKEIENISKYTTLTKTQINNIIRNLKNKFNRYYYGVKTKFYTPPKLKFHYFLCGEYGPNTGRSHYHIILMLEKPIPELKRLPIKNNYYESKYLKSKQYTNYTLEPIKIEPNIKVSNYLSKYLNKSQNDNNFQKYNLFQEKQILYYHKNNISMETPIVKNKEKFIQLLFSLLELQNNNIGPITSLDFKFTNITYQKEFIKYSRRLGISENHYENIQNNTFLPYYRYKYMNQNNLTFQNEWKDKLLNHYNDKRINNIIKYFGKNEPNKKNIKNKDKY